MIRDVGVQPAEIAGTAAIELRAKSSQTLVHRLGDDSGTNILIR
jgi:hypothetical protein